MTEDNWTMEEIVEKLEELCICPESMKQRIDSLCDDLLLLPLKERAGCAFYMRRRVEETNKLRQNIH